MRAVLLEAVPGMLRSMHEMRQHSDMHELRLEHLEHVSLPPYNSTTIIRHLDRW